jgi:hypothetical protein
MRSQQDLFVVPQPVIQAPAVVAAPEPDTSSLPLREWIRTHGYQYILCELVLPAKTIEANALLSAGPESELEYLIEAYSGNEPLLREDIAGVSTYLHGRNLQPRRGVMTKESSISSKGELQLES